MKNTVKTSRVAGQLEKMFRALNARFFGGELEEVVITLKKTPGAYGHITCGKTWSAGGAQRHEINISTATLDRPIEETAATLLHEMCHLYNLMHGVQDCSRGNPYHNKKFKETAEAHGLTVEKGEKYGWHKTALSPEALEFVQSLGKQGFTLVRPRPIGLKGSSKGGGSSSRKYVCPCCGAIIRATKEVHVICADCDCEFQEEI